MLDDKKILELKKKSIELSIDMVKMLIDSKSSGHLGGGLSVMDILTVLYFHVMNINPKDPCWEQRDRLVLSKGHSCCALCPVLAEKGYFAKDMLSIFNHFDSPFGMHPDMNKIKGCDMSTGSLGQGFSASVGMAIAARYLKNNCNIYAILGDGELGEGSVWESMAIASHFKLNNLCATIDRNGFSVDGPTDGIGKLSSIAKGIQGTLSLEPLDKKIEAYGWQVIRIDGHDIKSLIKAYDRAKKTKDRPTMVIADTVKGNGSVSIENDYLWHFVGFNEDKFKIVLNDLESKLAADVKN